MTPPDFTPNFTHEITYPDHRVIGVDEVGRGPLAGPVVAAAVMIAPSHYGLDLWSQVNDSKKIKPQKRAHLFDLIQTHSTHGIGVCSVEEIDEINILQAGFLAMKRAISALLQSSQSPHAHHAPSSLPPYILIDGKLKPKDWIWPSTAIIKGDSKSVSIAAASILAKVTRDRMMAHLAVDYPVYGWDQNAGYGTPHHLNALNHHGVTPHHRRSFAPIRNHKAA